MSEIKTTLVIQNQKGLHARAAATFVKCISSLDAEVFVEKDGQEVDGSSILGLMMLAASKGCAINIRASGVEARKAVDNLTALVNDLFGEEQ